jgi:bifunctional DNA-binding transcriptional regulator/antitoxin component of YhaV-PrlF toxin-antitoxin module
MPSTATIQLAQRGVLTLPKRVREAYRLQPGDAVTLLDLDGVLVLKPGRSDVHDLAERIAGDLAGQGETLESMLAALREVRDERTAG